MLASEAEPLNATTVSVMERAKQLNKMVSETDLQAPKAPTTRQEKVICLIIFQRKMRVLV